MLAKLWRLVKPEPSVLTLNTVPLPELPPDSVVPYKVLPDNIKPATGQAPSVLLMLGKEPEPAVKLCRFVNPVPSVLTLNNAPLSELPPSEAVPYRVLPDKTNPPRELNPSLLVKTPRALLYARDAKTCRFE